MIDVDNQKEKLKVDLLTINKEFPSAKANAPCACVGGGV